MGFSQTNQVVSCNRRPTSSTNQPLKQQPNWEVQQKWQKKNKSHSSRTKPADPQKLTCASFSGGSWSKESKSQSVDCWRFAAFFLRQQKYSPLYSNLCSYQKVNVEVSLLYIVFTCSIQCVNIILLFKSGPMVSWMVIKSNCEIWTIWCNLKNRSYPNIPFNKESLYKNCILINLAITVYKQGFAHFILHSFFFNLWRLLFRFLPKSHSLYALANMLY